MEQDRRSVERERVARSGKIIVIDGADIDCTIVDFSDQGAQLGVAPLAAVPPEFTLLDVDANRRYAVTTAWRQGNSLGVEFFNLADYEEV